MKTVFDNKQLAHIWSAQGQTTGRNATGSMYFNGDTIYSYGSHYAIARIYNNGKTGRDHAYFALINENNYSNSTSKQRGYVVNALRGRMNYIYVPQPQEIKHPDNEAYLLNNIAEIVDETLNMRCKHSYLLSVDVQIKQLNDLYSLAGIPKVFTLEDVWRDLMKEASRIKIDKQQEKIKMNEVKEAARARREQALYAFQIPLWQRHENKVRIPSHVFGYDYVRLTTDKSEVETSRGARVPIDHALRVLRLMLTMGIAGIGHRVGGFTIETAPDAEGFFKVGCHRLNINQCRDALAEVL